MQQLAPFMASHEEQQAAQELLGPLVDVFRSRPGEALAMAQVGPLVGAGPERAVELGIALGYLVDDGHLAQSSASGPAGPTWTLKGSEAPEPGTDKAAQVVPSEVISRTLGSLVLAGHPYPGALPDELAPWHCYVVDSGHCILIAIGKADELPAAPEIESYLVPAPVKSVLRSRWTGLHGYVSADLPYDEVLGLLAEEGDEEFDVQP
jgi:hypothetical protein